MNINTHCFYLEDNYSLISLPAFFDNHFDKIENWFCMEYFLAPSKVIFQALSSEISGK